MVFSSALGPFLFSAGHDYFGSYRAVTLACLALPLIVSIMGWLARDPQGGDA
jgi:cyanate permease